MKNQIQKTPNKISSISIEQLSERDHLLSRPEAAQYLAISIKTLATWQSTKRVKLPVTKIGRRVFYRESVLKKFIEDHTDK